MSPARVTFRRTIGVARSLYSTALSFAGFFLASALVFVYALERAEASRISLAAVWCSSVSPVLPALAALLGMGVWSDEKASGRIDTLLSAPVRERDLVIGKFLAVWTMTVFGALAFLAVSLVSLAHFAPDLPVSPLSFVPGIIALMLQGALWSAISVAASALFRHAAAAAAVSIFLTIALPRALWLAGMAFSAAGRAAFGEMPLDAHSFDMASGVVSSAAIVFYSAFSLFFLFIASKAVASTRLSGRGSSALRFSTRVSMTLALVLAVLATTLAARLDTTLDFLPGSFREMRFSARTRGILAESRGGISATVFLSRKDPRFRALAHFMRSFARAADSAGGAKITVKYVDPGWDPGAAGRLVRSGVPVDSVVFERGNRRESIPVGEGYSERVFASAVLKVARPPRRQNVYWTLGHGENSFDNYGAWGMSDVARDLARDGYKNLPLDLADEKQVPSDAAFVVIAGAKEDFSRIETGKLDAFLRQGGRLFAMVPRTDFAGISSLLSAWGLRPGTVASYASAKTLTGSDVVVTDLSATHPATSPLAGSRLVFEKPVAFTPSAAAGGGAADSLEFIALARVGESCVAAAAERGAAAGRDLSLRPTRIVAVGDDGFVLNGQLSARANANRDFFLNLAAYLSGTDAATEADVAFDRLVTGMDRKARRDFAATMSLSGVAAFIVLLALAAAGRRRR